MRDRTHDEAMAEVFSKDPAYALELLNSILEDGGQAELMIALRQIAIAFGGMSKVAEQAQLNKTHIYRAFSDQGKYRNSQPLCDFENDGASPCGCTR